MKITIQQIGTDFTLKASNETGNSLFMDSAPEAGGSEKGMRPMQLLLSALGGCSAIDIIGILKKQKQEVVAFEIEVNGERKKKDGYSLFRHIELHFKLKGALDVLKVEKAVRLSLDKYCSVAKTLEPTAQITSLISINGITITTRN